MSMNDVPYGYQRIDGELVPHPIDSEYVKWTYTTSNKYHEHPPAELVHDIIERHLEETGETLSYEDAEKQVLSSSIDNYLQLELKTKKSLFDGTAQENTPEELKEILGLPLDEAKQRLAALPRESAKASYDFVGKYEAGSTAVVHEPIISQEMFAEVRQKLAEGAANEEGVVEDQGMKMF